MDSGLRRNGTARPRAPQLEFTLEAGDCDAVRLLELSGERGERFETEDAGNLGGRHSLASQNLGPDQTELVEPLGHGAVELLAKEPLQRPLMVKHESGESGRIPPGAFRRFAPLPSFD